MKLSSNPTQESVHSALHLHELLSRIVWQNFQILFELINNSGFHDQLIGIHEIFNALQYAIHSLGFLLGIAEAANRGIRNQVDTDELIVSNIGVSIFVFLWISKTTG